MSTYLVTGVAGFIAARTAGMLLEAGHSVVGLDNMNDAYDVRMKQYRLSHLQANPAFTFLHLDISDKQAVQEIPKPSGGKFDAIINLAARAGVRQAVQNPWVYVATNMTGTLNLLEYAQRQDVPKFILASTSSIYGADAPLPTPETADSDHPLQPYAASKKGAEAMCYAYHHLYGIDVSVVRYFTVYGPAGRPDMSMFRFTQWISEGLPLRLNGDGQQSRGFTYVDDIARGTIQALKPLGYEIINLGGHESVRMIDVIRMIEQAVGKVAQIEYHPFHPADMFANLANVEKAGRLLGWEPQIGLQAGIEKLVAWYNAERTWASQIITD